jgi:hypothetical protein
MKPLTVKVGFTILGATFGVLGFVIIQFFVGPKGAATDSPIVVRGGSVGGIGTRGWTKVDAHNFHADVGGPANTLDLDGIDTTLGDTTHPAKDFTINKLQTNWKITLLFRDSTATKLQICSSVSCSTSGTVGSTIYLVGDQNDEMKLDSGLDRSGVRMHFKLYQCDTSSDPDPVCNHIANVTMAGIPGYSGPYQCVDGTCDIGIDTK